MPDITLHLAGAAYAGWQEIRISRSLEVGADVFELTLTEDWQTARRRPIQAGAACQVRLDGQTLITGYVDEAAPGYDAERHQITVTGRSRVADLVDCSLVGSAGKSLSWKDVDLTYIATDLAARFDVEVRPLADVGGPFAQRQTLDPGQPVFEFLEGLARIRGVRLVSAPDGALEIVRASRERLPVPLELGVNIRAAAARFSVRDAFSTYTVLAQHQGAVWGASAADAEAAAHPKGEATDATVPRYRPTVQLAETAADAAECQKRAEWHRNAAYGRGREVVYTVDGWTYDGATPWTHNRVVRVVDPWLGIEGDRLIAAVQFLLDDNGRRTELRTLPPQALDLVALPEPKAESTGWAVNG